MKVVVHQEFKASRKEPLGDLIRRIAAGFERAGIQPEIVATFSDGPALIVKTSAVERALKKYPRLAALERNDAPVPNVPAMRRLSNSDGSTFPISDVLALADGVPRSLPFHGISVLFGHAGFGEIPPWLPGRAGRSTGIAVTDSWWVNGRNRGITVFYAVEAGAASKRLPDPPPAIASILAELGKPKSSSQFVPPAAAAASTTPSAARPEAGTIADAAAVAHIVRKYRDGMGAMLERIGLPHDLPSPADARRTNRGGSGPLKPTLVAAFKPRGYDCRGGSGTFTLRRRTAAHHVLDLDLDVGTWSRSLTAMFHVRGPDFAATVILPVTLHGAGQYPIGDTANWERIVANLAAIVDELERTFVPEIEAAAGPAPEWFDVGS